VVADPVRNRAQQEALGAGHALVADDDQISVALLGDVEDRVGRVARTREGLNRHAGGLRGGRRVGQQRGRILACTVERADHEQLRTDGLRELGRLADRLLRRVGPVGPHNDRAEHGPDSSP
jgi:hypothetical protein